MVVNQNYFPERQPMAPIAEGIFPMGISKIGPNKYFIKARIKIPNPDPRLPPDDRRAQVTFEGTKHQAEEQYMAMKVQLRGERAKAGTFGQLMESYKLSRGGVIPRSQRAVYQAVLDDLGGIPTEPAKLEAALRQYASLMLRFPSKRSGKMLAAGTRNRYRAMVGAAINLGILTKDIPGPSILTKAIWPKAKEVPRDRRLTPEEVARLMTVVEAEAPHLRWIFWYALRVPCRKDELINMGPQHLDLFQNLIRVANGTTKNDDGVWKPIPGEMLAYFRAIPPGCLVLFWRMGKGTKKGQYLPLGDFKRAWGRCLRLAGIHNFRFHDTRRISATNLIQAGMTERDVMKIGGWNTNMFATYWASESQESAKRATFLPGIAVAGGNLGATLTEAAGKSSDSVAERAVI